jgi:hypothetical protein
VNKQANKPEEAVRKRDVKELYNITRNLFKRNYRDVQPIKNKDGVMFKN